MIKVLKEPIRLGSASPSVLERSWYELINGLVAIQ